MPLLQRCHDSIASAATLDGAVEVILVDHGSTDGSSEVAASFTSGVGGQVIRTDQGPVGRLRNLGVARTVAPILSFVDSDCIVPGDYFATIRGALERGFDVVGSRYRLPDEPHWIEALWEPLHTPARPEEENYINGGNFACRSEVFHRVGGFEESLEAGEDEELLRRMRAAGCRVEIDRSVVAVHLGNPKTLRQFFRQQRWHGNGALHVGGSLLMPAIAMAYLLTTIAVVPAYLVLGPTSSAAFLLAQQALPAGAVWYRAGIQGRPCRRWLDALLLYHVCLAARAVALTDQLRGFRFQGHVGARE